MKELVEGGVIRVENVIVECTGKYYDLRDVTKSYKLLYISFSSVNLSTIRHASLGKPSQKLTFLVDMSSKYINLLREHTKKVTNLHS